MAYVHGDKNSDFVKGLTEPVLMVYKGRTSKFRRVAPSGYVYSIRSNKPFWVDERDVAFFTAYRYKRASFILVIDGEPLVEVKAPLPDSVKQQLTEQSELVAQVAEAVELEIAEEANETVELEIAEEANENKFDFTSLSGVGQKTSDNINSIGISNFQELAMYAPEMLAEELSISLERAESVVEQAIENNN